jgi:hypothetical protein
MTAYLIKLVICFYFFDRKSKDRIKQGLRKYSIETFFETNQYISNRYLNIICKFCGLNPPSF